MQKLHQLHGSSPEEEAKRLRRLRRFEEDAAQFKADNVSTPMQQLHLVCENSMLLCCHFVLIPCFFIRMITLITLL